MTLPPIPTCPICQGRRHVLKGKAWVRCACAERAARARACREAGVPARFAAAPLAELAARAVLPRGLRVPLLPGRGAVVWSHVPGSPWRGALTSAYVLRAYIDAGMAPRSARVPDLIEACFDRDLSKAWKAALRDAPAMVVEVSNPAGHRYAAAVLEELWAARRHAQALTVLVSSDDIGRCPARYGEAIAAACASRRGIGYARFAFLSDARPPTPAPTPAPNPPRIRPAPRPTPRSAVTIFRAKPAGGAP